MTADRPTINGLPRSTNAESERTFVATPEEARGEGDDGVDATPNASTNSIKSDGPNFCRFFSIPSVSLPRPAGQRSHTTCLTLIYERHTTRQTTNKGQGQKRGRSAASPLRPSLRSMASRQLTGLTARRRLRLCCRRGYAIGLGSRRGFAANAPLLGLATRNAPRAHTRRRVARHSA